MSASQAGSFEDGSQAPGVPVTRSFHAVEPPTESLLTGPVGDRCANCDAPLAADQRYCLQCGQRRGRSRFATPAPPPMSPPPVVAVSGPASEGPRRSSAGMTLIAGIATLILAMGVGVVIGQNNGTGTPVASKASPPEVIVNGGGSGAVSGTSTGANLGTAQGGKAAKAVKAPKTEAARAKKAAAASKPTTAAVQKASHAASSVLGGGNTQAPTVTSGSTCQAGSPGCTNGKFTGSFFGN